MRLTERLDYPAPPDEVFTMMVARDFRDAVCEATGALSWSVEIDQQADGASVTVRRVMPAQVPAAVKKFLGETIEVVQSEQWESADGATRRAEVLVEVEDQPAKMIGTLTMRPAGGGTALDVDGEVTVKIPFFGGRLEEEVAKQIKLGLAVEQRTGQAYLTS